MEMDRRAFLANAAATATATATATAISSIARCRANEQASGSTRVAGMLYGSLIGDALGGPIEFLAPDRVGEIMPSARTWPENRTLGDGELKRLAEALRMVSYAQLRPDVAAYGPWAERAEAGTITDDSRHKIVLMRALRKMLAAGRQQLRPQDLATEYVSFVPIEGTEPDAALDALVREGLREYRMASRWVLGERNLQAALPLERLWAGVSNCSGQMALLPLACAFPGQPERAYRETFRLDFIDAPIARDIVSALNAGLAAALDPATDGISTRSRWERLLDAMRHTDPYRFAEVPFAGRQLTRWLDLSDSIVERSEGRPAVAYRLLETEGKPVYYWDAHFTLLVPITMLRLCQFNPLAALHLTLDFGHDTDSYAQVLGAMAGAVHGMGIWKETMTSAVATRLAADYGESLEEWTQVLAASAQRWVDDVE